MSQQAALNLTWPERYGIENYIVAPCNEHAFQAMQHADQWKTYGLLLTGPVFSGKTHLAHIFQKTHDALMVSDAKTLQNAVESDHAYVVIDSADRILSENPEITEALFHLVNAASLNQKYVLITALDQPAQWVKLPDLRSRLQACQHIELKQPDEEMIHGAYQKLFTDRGLLVDNKVLDYLALRSERSFAGIRKIVETLDTLALEQSRKITVPLIQSANLF